MYLLDFSIRHQYGRFCIAMGGGGGSGCGGVGKRIEIWDRETMFLQSGHLAWWSADKCKGNNSIVLKIVRLPICFFRKSFLSCGTELAKRKMGSTSMKTSFV